MHAHVYACRLSCCSFPSPPLLVRSRRCSDRRSRPSRWLQSTGGAGSFLSYGSDGFGGGVASSAGLPELSCGGVGMLLLPRWLVVADDPSVGLRSDVIPCRVVKGFGR